MWSGLWHGALTLAAILWIWRPLQCLVWPSRMIITEEACYSFAPTDMPAPVDIWLLFKWCLPAFPWRATDRLAMKTEVAGSITSVRKTVICTLLLPGISSLDLPREQILSLNGSLTTQKGF